MPDQVRHGGKGSAVTTIRTVAETGSTNADLAQLARTGLPEGVWLRAERQTGGRGRQGRAWVSPFGNLHASTLVRLRPTDPPPATLGLAVAVALEEAVRVHLSGGDLRIRWPNDLLLGGAKLSGVLLERVDQAVVVGVGVNLAHAPDLPDRATTSLAEYDAPVAPGLFAETLAEAFARWLQTWRGQGIAPVRARWLDRAHPVGTALAARLPDGSAAEGLFAGLDADGALILRLADGRARVIHAADILLG